jgi:DNA-directed RNA polymerase subunit H
MKELDVTKHILVPKHEIISESEKEELLKKYGITLRQLPRILLNDPAIKHLNPKVGDVVRIIRKSPTAGEVEYYRVVVKG